MLATSGICKKYNNKFICSSCGNDIEIEQIIELTKDYCIKCKIDSINNNYAHIEKIISKDCQ
jgi:hypothetical protein